MNFQEWRTIAVLRLKLIDRLLWMVHNSDRLLNAKWDAVRSSHWHKDLWGLSVSISVKRGRSIGMASRLMPFSFSFNTTSSKTILFPRAVRCKPSLQYGIEKDPLNFLFYGSIAYQYLNHGIVNPDIWYYAAANKARIRTSNRKCNSWIHH